MNSLKNINKIVEDLFLIKKGVNKKNEIARLIFEILKKEDISLKELIQKKELQKYIKNSEYNFKLLKNILIKIRYPYYTPDEKNIFLPKLENPIKREYFFNGTFKPKKIYIENEAKEYALTKNILKKFPDSETIYIEKIKNIKRSWKHFLHSIGKDELFLVKENYDIFKSCPCSSNVISCGYYIFNLGFGCPYDCSYCYLQHYTNFPGIILQVNINEILDKLKNILNTANKHILRIGTGEFTDSLVFDNITEYSKYIVPFFAHTSHLLELKTKSINIDNLLNLDHNNKTVVSWSLNTPYIIEKEELFTPSLENRLKAAKKVIKAGYKVGFHFDPIIYYDNWEKDYKDTIDMMFDYAKNNILWISLGTLRFHRDLKKIIETRFPDNVMLDGELILDNIDKKMRYPEKLKTYMFDTIMNYIKKQDKKILVYMCMEDKTIWQNIYGTDFKKSNKNETLGIRYHLHS